MLLIWIFANLIFGAVLFGKSQSVSVLFLRYTWLNLQTRFPFLFGEFDVFAKYVNYLLV